MPSSNDSEWPDSFNTSGKPLYTLAEPYLMFQAPVNETPYQRKMRMISQLRNACMACTMCELGRQGATKDKKLYRDPHVFSNQNPTRFVVVGQNPGWNELEKCEPFVGQAGGNFDDELEKNGLTRDIFYICNTVRCYTEGNRKPSQLHVERCEPFLRMEMTLLRPQLVIALGAVAYERLCPDNKESFNDALGTIVHSSRYDVKVYTIYHPSPLNMRDAGRKRMFQKQIRMLCKLIKKIQEDSNS